MYDDVHSVCSMPPYAGRILAIAASAGGIEALSEFVHHLPACLPAPVVVVQHLAPNRTSHLREILQRRTSLPVEWAVHGGSLSAGRIYLAPPDRHVIVEPEGVLTVSCGPAVERVRPSADVLFRSVAACFGPRAVGIVLTGCLGDGAQGAHAIRHEGGRVLVQQPELCPYPTMPLAAMQTGAVDFCLSVKNLAAAATAIISVPGAAELFTVGERHRHKIAAQAWTHPDRFYFSDGFDNTALLSLSRPVHPEE